MLFRSQENDEDRPLKVAMEDNEDIQDVPNPRTIGINFHNDSDVIVASQGAFGIDMSEANRVIEVKASGITK